MNKTIEQALSNLRRNQTRYEKAERYYDGDHDLAFATEKFQNTFGTLFREFALNLCPVICDKKIGDKKIGVILAIMRYSALCLPGSDGGISLE